MLHVRCVWSTTRCKATLAAVTATNPLAFEDIPVAPESGFGPLRSSLAYFTKDNGFNKTHKLFQALHQEMGPIVRVRFMPFTRYSVSIADPEIVALIFRSEGQMPNRPFIQAWQVYRDRRQLPRGTVNTNDYAEWKKYRASMRDHLLNKNNVPSWLKPIDDVAQDVVARIATEAQNSGGIVAISTTIKAYALESVSAVVFGKRMGCISSDPEEKIMPEANEFITAVAGYFATSQQLRFVPRNLPRSIYPYLPAFKEHEAHSDSLFGMGERFLQEKLKSKDATKHSDLLTMFMERPELNERDAISQTIDVLMAGVDTTGITLLWLLYSIASAPNSAEIQVKLRDEVHAAMGSKHTIDEEALGKLSYVRACVKETLRLYPTVNPNVRMTTEDMDIHGFKVPKGTMLWMATYTMSRNPEIFDDPNVFIPERWERNDEKKKRAMEAYSTLPFGMGVRSCPGRRLAETEIYLLLAHLIRKLEIKCLPNEVPLEGEFATFLVPERQLSFSFHPWQA